MRVGNAIIAILILSVAHVPGYSQEWEEVGCPKNSEGKNLPVFDLVSMDNGLYAATDQRIWQSTDNGMSWESAGLTADFDDQRFPVSDLLVHNDLLYAAADKVYRRIAEGEWEQIGGTVDHGCNNPRMTLAAFKGDLFVNVPQCNGNGVYKLANMSGNWNKNTGPGNFVIWSDADMLFAGRKYSTDGGNWSSLKGVKGEGAIYAYTEASGRYYIGAYPITSTDPVSVSEDGKNFSSFSNGLWKHSLVAAFSGWGDSVFCLAQESDYLDSSKNHVYWIDSESTRWNKLGGPLYMTFDRAGLAMHNGWLYVACNGTEFKKLGGGKVERVGGYGIRRFLINEGSTRAAVASVSRPVHSDVKVKFDRSAQRIHLNLGERAGHFSELLVSIYSAGGRKVSEHRISDDRLAGNAVSVSYPNSVPGVLQYRITGNRLLFTGRLIIH